MNMKKVLSLNAWDFVPIRGIYNYCSRVLEYDDDHPFSQGDDKMGTTLKTIFLVEYNVGLFIGLNEFASGLERIIK